MVETKQKQVEIVVDGVGRFHVDLVEKGGLFHPSVLEWPTLSEANMTPAGYKDPDEAIEATRTFLRETLWANVPPDCYNELVEVAQQQFEYDGQSWPLYVLSFCLDPDQHYYFVRAGYPYKKIAHTSGVPSQSLGAVREAIRSHWDAWKAQVENEAPAVIDQQERLPQTIEEAERYGDGVPTAIEVVTDEEDAETPSEYSFEMPEVEFQRTFTPVKVAHWRTNDKRPVYFSVVLDDIGNALELTGRSQFEFIGPDFDKDGVPVFDENDILQTVPILYDYSVSLRREKPEEAALLDNLIADDCMLDHLEELDAEFCKACFDVFYGVAEPKVAEQCQALALRLEQVKEVGLLQKYQKLANEGDLGARAKFSRLLASYKAKQTRQAQGQQVVAVSKGQAKQMGVDIDNPDLNRQQRRAAKRNRRIKSK